MLSQIYASVWSFLPRPMKQRSSNYLNVLQLLWKRFLCILFFQVIQTNYMHIPTYMKTNHIFFVIKGQFSVIYFIFNTIILLFIVHCIYDLCLFLHGMHPLISYVTCEWPEMYSFLFYFIFIYTIFRGVYTFS